MKTLTLLLFSLFSLPLMLNAQTADEMLHKVMDRRLAISVRLSV